MDDVHLYVVIFLYACTGDRTWISISSGNSGVAGFLAWTCDALEFFNVSISVTQLSKQFHRVCVD